MSYLIHNSNLYTKNIALIGLLREKIDAWWHFINIFHVILHMVDNDVVVRHFLSHSQPHTCQSSWEMGLDSST